VPSTSNNRIGEGSIPGPSPRRNHRLNRQFGKSSFISLLLNFMCAILFKITSRPPLLNPLQPKSKVLQVSLSTILAMQFQHNIPSVVTLMKSTEPGWTTCWIWRRRWDKLALSTFVLSWLTLGREQTLQPCLTDLIEVTKPCKFTLDQITKQNLVCLTGLLFKE